MFSREATIAAQAIYLTNSGPICHSKTTDINCLRFETLFIHLQSIWVRCDLKRTCHIFVTPGLGKKNKTFQKLYLLNFHLEMWWVLNNSYWPIKMTTKKNGMSHQFWRPDRASGGRSQNKPVHPPEQPQSTPTVSFSHEIVSFSRIKHSPPFWQGFGSQLVRTHCGMVDGETMRCE